MVPNTADHQQLHVRNARLQMARECLQQTLATADLYQYTNLSQQSSEIQPESPSGIHREAQK